MLFNLAEAADLAGKRAAMFTGEKINNTEQRAVMHVALRAPKDAVRFLFLRMLLARMMQLFSFVDQSWRTLFLSVSSVCLCLV